MRLIVTIAVGVTGTVLVHWGGLRRFHGIRDSTRGWSGRDGGPERMQRGKFVMCVGSWEVMAICINGRILRVIRLCGWH